ncbi:MAG TPA: PAS domain S-box protein [Opitutaceae bacterium]
MPGPQSSEGTPSAQPSMLSGNQGSFAALLASVPGMVYRCRNDREWTMLLVSEGCRTLTGYAPEDLVENRRVSFGSLIDPVDRARIWDEVQGELRAGETFELTYRIRTAAGAVRWVSEHGRRVLSESGGFVLEGCISDVTARREKEERLAESDRINSAIIDQTFQFIGLLDVEGRIVKSNQTALDAAGIRMEAVAGRHFWDTPWWSHSVEEQIRLRESVARVAQGEFIRYETTHPLADGRIIHVDFSLKPISDAGGRVVGLVAEGRDVTDHKRAEEALKASEEKFSSAFHASPDAVILSRVDTGRIVDCNEGFERIFGWTRDEAIGRTSLELGLWNNAQDRVAVLAEALATGKVRGFRGVGRHRSGEQRDVLLAIETARIGGVPHHVVVTHDITEQVRAERALRDSEERFAKAFNASPDSITLTDLVTGRIVDCNKGFERVFGWKREEALGRTTYELGLWDDPAQREQLTRQVKAGETVRDQRAVGRRRNGERCEALVSLDISEIGGVPHLILVARDITEQVRAEQALRDSEERFAKAFHASPDAIAITDRETHRIVDCNEGFERLFGYTRAEAIGRIPSELGLWADGGDRDRMAELVTNGPVRDFQATGVHRNGNRIECLLSVHPTTIAGRPCVIGVARDVTARLRAERALRDSEERFAKAFHASPDSITISDLTNHQLVDCNEGFERMFGYSRDEVVGRSSAEIGLWVDISAREQVSKLVRTVGSVRDFETSARTKDGRRIECQLSIHPATIGGNPCVITVTRDVTARVHAERALRESEEKFAKAFRAGPYALTISDLETGRYLEVNDGFEEIFGCSRTEAIGRTSHELGMWNDPAARERLIAALKRDGEVRAMEIAFRRRDERVIHCRCSCEQIELGGRACMVTVTEDVTAQREADRSRLELENQLRQAQRLDALGQLAGGIAHDFNNILTGVMAYTELALMEAHRPAEVKKHLTEVRKAGERAKDLVRQILAFSRQQQQERKPVRLHTTMREAVKLLRSTLPKTIGIESDIESNAPVVLADLTQIHQVMLNLCTNAAHAMRGKAGRLKVTLETVALEMGGSPTGLRPGRHALIAISDTGHGMDESVRARIFEPFFTTKAPGEGTGLGLSVVHGIVEDHDGAITVDSRVGDGTTFRLYFPEHVTEEAEPTMAAIVAPKGGGQRVLFIDDEKMITDVVGRLLSRMGYKPSTFTDPEAGLAALAADPGAFDLVFTDLTMPGITGVEVARRALELRPGIPVIMATGYSGSWTAENLRALGISALVQKPLTPASLAEVVAAALTPPAAGN